MNEKEIKQWMDENLLTKKEAMELTGQSLKSFDQAVITGRIKPFFERGKARGLVRLYLKSELIKYNDERLATIKKRNIKL